MWPFALFAYGRTSLAYAATFPTVHLVIVVFVIMANIVVNAILITFANITSISRFKENLDIVPKERIPERML